MCEPRVGCVKCTASGRPSPGMLALTENLPSASRAIGRPSTVTPQPGRAAPTNFRLPPGPTPVLAGVCKAAVGDALSKRMVTLLLRDTRPPPSKYSVCVPSPKPPEPKVYVACAAPIARCRPPLPTCSLNPLALSGAGDQRTVT